MQYLRPGRRELSRLAVAAVVTLLTPTLLLAQGRAGGGAAGGGGNFGGGGNAGGGGGNSSLNASNFSLGSGLDFSAGFGQSGLTNSATGGAATRSGRTGTTGVPSTANILSPHYNHVLADGLPSGSAGAFGAPLYQNLGTGTGLTGSASTRGGAAGVRTTGTRLANTRATGGFGGSTGARTSTGGMTAGGFGGATGARTGAGGFGGATGGRTAGGFGGATGGRTAGGFGGTTGGFGAAGRTGGFGGTTGGFGGGRTGGFGNTGNVVATQSVPYAAQPGFAVSRPVPTQFQADLRNVLTRSSSLPSGRNIDLTVNGTVVVLRGRVTDDRERRLAENLLRLSPGVREIRNELEIPDEAPPASEP